MTTFLKSNISDAWIIDPLLHNDIRGSFQELFKFSTIKKATGLVFNPLQINVSRSVQGVIRGVHYSVASTGQSKYITALDGEIDDYIIDVRPNSSTFGQWQKVRLSSDVGNSVLLGPHLAHAFQVISQQATVCYAVTAEYNPQAEQAINPNCPELSIDWNPAFPQLLSPKDEAAPNLRQQFEAGLLPKQ